MLLDRAGQDCPGGQRFALHGFRIIHKKLYSHGRELRGGGASGSVCWIFGCEEKPGAANRKAAHNMPAALEMPENSRSECGFVEFDRGGPIAHG